MTHLDRLRMNERFLTEQARIARGKLDYAQIVFDNAERERLTAVDAITDYVTERKETER